MVHAKYAGMHALRHFFASRASIRKRRAGRELPPGRARPGGRLVHHDDGRLCASRGKAAELVVAEKAFLVRNTVAASR